MNLASYLKKTGVTQAKFAERIGVTQGMVWQWLRGRRRIAAEQVLAIETATEGRVTRHEMRPDIYPREPRKRA